MRRISRNLASPSRELYLLLFVATLFFALNLRWIWLYRHDNLLDIDEAGYFGFAVIDYYGGHFGGLTGWVNAVNMPSIQAPLLTAVTSIFFLLFGVHPIWGFVTTAGFATLAILVTAGIGTTLRSPQAGLIAALLTACCPVIVNYSRSFQFSAPATFVTALAVLAMLRSRRFGHIGWAAVFGIALGLMPLARTMTIAFLPGLLLAGLVCLLGERRHVLRRLAIFAASVLLAVVVSASWLASNGVLVFHYLFSFGYGRQALEYGQANSKFGPDAWMRSLHAMVGDIYLPFFAVLCAAAVLGLGLLIGRLRKEGLGRTIATLLRSPAFLVFIVVAEQLAALTTSSNKGSGFFAPLIPPLAALMAYSLTGVPALRRHKARTVAAVGVLAALLWLPLIQLIPGLSHRYVTDLPFIGFSPISDGRGTIQSDEARAGYGAPGALAPVSSEQAHRWGALSNDIADYLINQFGKDILVEWGFRNELVNVNTVQLSNLLHRGSAFAAIMIDPSVVQESAVGYADWLGQNCAKRCVLLTSDRVSGDFLPPVNRPLMAQAARARGFSPVKTWIAPDDQRITLWTYGTTKAAGF
jgi:4-amino-4-deoxy-L-arabinose transferase-like glycosyltransferase